MVGTPVPVIDTHSHWLPPAYLELLLGHAAAGPPFAELHRAILGAAVREDTSLRQIALRLDAMDASGIDTAVLSLPPPAACFGDIEAARGTARTGNDEMLDAADAHPGRFAVFLALPFPDVDGCLAELDRAASREWARGVGLLTSTAPWSIDDHSLDAVYRRAAELGLPLQAHPAKAELPACWSDWKLDSSLGPMMNSSLGAARMVLSGTLDRVPALEIIVPHLGGTLPYLAQRMDDFGRGDAEHELSHYLRTRLHFDTCSFHTPAFRCAVETVGVERLVLGSDFPFRGSLDRLRADVEAALPDPHERDLVLGLTASRWFGMRER